MERERGREVRKEGRGWRCKEVEAEVEEGSNGRQDVRKEEEVD